MAEEEQDIEVFAAKEDQNRKELGDALNKTMVSTRTEDSSDDGMRAGVGQTESESPDHGQLLDNVSLEEAEDKEEATDEESTGTAMVEEKSLTEDTFSFMITSDIRSQPFWLSIIVAFLQFLTFSLLAFSLVDLKNTKNPFDIPVDVQPAVRIAQLVAILLSIVATPTDIHSSFDLVKDGFTKDFQQAFEDATFWKFVLSIVLRIFLGSIGLILMFTLIVSAKTVIDLLLNFTALEFVTLIDEAFFVFSKQGFVGKICEAQALKVEETTYPVPRRPYKRIAKYGLMVAILVGFLAGWTVILQKQRNADFLCSTVRVQFGDDAIPALGTFSGLYDKRPNPSGIFQSARVDYVQRGYEDRGAVFSYCSKMKAWTFRWQDDDGTTLEGANESGTGRLLKRTRTEGDNGGSGGGGEAACEWIARSAQTESFDLTKTVDHPWYIQDEDRREFLLEPMYIHCYDCESSADECSGRGTCSDAVCECNSGWTGLRCDLREPCSTLSIDVRFEGFPGFRAWSTIYELLEDNDGPIYTYKRPVYVGQSHEGSSLEVMFFTGRRWAAAFVDYFKDMPISSTMGRDEIKSVMADYFQTDFHGHWSNYSVEFLSVPMDIERSGDIIAPTGLKWFFAERMVETESNQIQAPDVALPVDTILLCSVCDATNPCRYDGFCNEDGDCQCALASKGKLCEDAPVGNGHCDPYFNRPEFDMDGGDCCDSTCVSTDMFSCGIDKFDTSTKAGWSNAGYFFCALPKNEWRQNGAPILGHKDTFAGAYVALSDSGNVVAFTRATVEGAGQIEIHDKDGSQWKLRSAFPIPLNSTVYTLQIGEGPHLYHSNPLFYIPVDVVLVVEDIDTRNRTAHAYKCEEENCEVAFHLPGIHNYHYSRMGASLTEFPNNNSTREVCFPDSTCVAATFGNESDALVFKLSISDDSQVIALLSKIPPEEGLGLLARVYQWNDTSASFTQMGDALVLSLSGSDHQIYLSNVVISGDGSVLAVHMCGEQPKLHVFAWDGETWHDRRFPQNVYAFCMRGPEVRPDIKPKYLELSRTGNIIALFRGFSWWGTDYDDDGLVDTVVFEWEGSFWQQIGQPLGAFVESTISLSSDGLVIAIGEPHARLDHGGEVNMYSRPADDSNKCASKGQSLLRVSLMINSYWHIHDWWLVNEETRSIEMIDSVRNYPSKSAFPAIVDETCLDDVETSCYSFYAFDMPGKGVIGPGALFLFLDGNRLFDYCFHTGFMRKESFGGGCSSVEPTTVIPGNSNQTCSDGETLLQIVAPLLANSDGLTWRVYNKMSNVEVLAGGPYPANASQLIDQESCLDLASDCFLITTNAGIDTWTMYDNFRLYLDGQLMTDVSDRMYIGKNECCPDDTTRLTLRIFLCGRAQWRLETPEGTILYSGDTFDKYPELEGNATYICDSYDAALEDEIIDWEQLSEPLCLNLAGCWNLSFSGMAFPNLAPWGRVEPEQFENYMLFGDCSDGDDHPASTSRTGHQAPMDWDDGQF